MKTHLRIVWPGLLYTMFVWVGLAAAVWPAEAAPTAKLELVQPATSGEVQALVTITAPEPIRGWFVTIAYPAGLVPTSMRQSDENFVGPVPTADFQRTKLGLFSQLVSPSNAVLMCESAAEDTLLKLAGTLLSPGQGFSGETTVSLVFGKQGLEKIGNFKLENISVLDMTDGSNWRNVVLPPERAAVYRGLTVVSSPNPFNPATTIRYSLPADGNVAVEIYNPLGQLVRTLVTGYKIAGAHTVVWDGKDARGQIIASGVYIAKINAGSQGAAASKMLLLK